MPAHWNNVLYYVAFVVLVGGFIAGLAYALRARREAREGVDLTSDNDMLSEFQRARDAGEMDDAEFRRVRDLLINGKGSEGAEHRIAKPDSSLEGGSPKAPPPESPTPIVPE